MSRRSTIIIMILMSIALLGVSVIQFFWIKWSLNIKENNFNNQVYQAINFVKIRLLEDVETKEFYQTYLQQKKVMCICRTSSRAVMDGGNNSWNMS